MVIKGNQNTHLALELILGTLNDQLYLYKLTDWSWCMILTIQMVFEEPSLRYKSINNVHTNHFVCKIT